ncbi:MAG TPA: POTRA domain-containing protein [Acidobacteriaceae bacterium]|nr:POTRA domain-containing protein [Acidobacteriaceae bacterium]
MKHPIFLNASSMKAHSKAGRRWTSHHGLRNAAVLLASLSLTFFLSAQAAKPSPDSVPRTSPETLQILSSYEGQKVTSIEIAGRPDLKTSQFEPSFVQKAGQPFSKEKVDATIAAIERSGKFSNVQLQVAPEADGVRVLLVLQPAVYFGIFEFPGAGRFSYSRLVQVANYPPTAPFNAGDIDRDQTLLVNFFEQQGYFQAEVRPEVQVDAAHGIANVIFHVSLGRRARFGAVEISGAPPQQAEQLRDSLHGFMARVRGSAIRPGKNYRYKTITNAGQYLQRKLEKQDRLAADVKPAGAEYHPSTNRADIHFNVNPGPLVHVQIKGAHLWSWTRKSLLPVYQGVGVDPELVQEGQEALLSYFQAKGYFDVKVSSQFRQESAGDTILYQITKEKKHEVTSVAVAGNGHIPSGQLLPHVSVEKAHLFSHGKYSEELVRASAKNLAAVYQSEGYSSVHVTSTVTHKGDDVQVVFHVDEGPQDIVQAIRIEGARTFPEADFAPGGLKLAPGSPYSQKLVESDRAGIISHYLQAGYLIANFRETAAPVSKGDPHHINVVYHIEEGPQVHTGDVITLGRQHTQPRLIQRDVASIQPEKPMTETHLLTAESQLYNHTGVFDWAEVDPKRQITTQTTEDVLVKVHEAKRNEITYGFGFEVLNRGGSIPSGTVALPNLPPIGLPASFKTNEKTFYGPRGSFQYTRNNMRGKGESLSFTAFAGRLDQRGSAYYIDPNFRWTQWRGTASISIDHDAENPIFSSQVELGSYELQRFLDKAKKANILFLRYSYSRTDLTRIEIPALVLPQDQHVRLSTVSANFTRDTRDNVLDAHKGLLDTIEFDISSSKLGGSVDFAKMTAQSAYYKRIFHDTIWANSIRLGLAQSLPGSRVPLSEKFFSGGGNTLRGFPLDGAGPQRQVPVCSAGSSTDCTLIPVPSGGNEMLILNSELRVPLPIKKGLGIVAFYDGGNVFPDVGFHDFTSLYSNNVGVGLRYATPVGPIRVDIGRNLNPIQGINATQYFVSIGQAF